MVSIQGALAYLFSARPRSDRPCCQPHFPNVSWAPLQEVKVVERGLHADSAKRGLLSAASKVVHLTPAIGTELHGIDLRQLSDSQKDEL